jgi:hypothetical protein
VQLEIEPDDGDVVNREASAEDDADEDDTDEDDADKDDADEDDVNNDDADNDDTEGDNANKDDAAEGKLEVVHKLLTFNPFSNVYPVSSLFWLKNLTTLLSFTSIYTIGRSFSVPQTSIINLE